VGASHDTHGSETAALPERVAQVVDRVLLFSSNLFDAYSEGAVGAVSRAAQLAGELAQSVGEFVGGLLGGGASEPGPAGGGNPSVPPAVPAPIGPVPSGGGSSPSSGGSYSWSAGGTSGGLSKDLLKEFGLVVLFSVLLVQGGRVVRYSREPLVWGRVPLLAVERPG
jgi:hypothetical protein